MNGIIIINKLMTCTYSIRMPLNISTGTVVSGPSFRVMLGSSRQVSVFVSFANFLLFNDLYFLPLEQLEPLSPLHASARQHGERPQVSLPMSALAM